MVLDIVAVMATVLTDVAIDVLATRSRSGNGRCDTDCAASVVAGVGADVHNVHDIDPEVAVNAAN